MVPLCYGWLVVVVAVLLVGESMGVETKDLVDVVPPGFKGSSQHCLVG